MWEQGATRGRRSQKHGHEWGAVTEPGFSGSLWRGVWSNCQLHTAYIKCLNFDEPEAQRKFPHLITLKRVDADSNQLYGRLVQISDGEVRNWPLGQQVESHFPLEQC